LCFDIDWSKKFDKKIISRKKFFHFVAKDPKSQVLQCNQINFWYD